MMRGSGVGLACSPRLSARPSARPSVFAGVVGFAAVTFVAVAAAMVTSGCGNYSNEDLEYMNAVPVREEVRVDAPIHGAIVRADTADAWRTTWKVIQTMNGVADAFLRLIDQVRSTYPTERRPNERIWGPYSAERQPPGWQVRFWVRRDAADPTRFEYALEMLPPPGLIPEASLQIITGHFFGQFASNGGVRSGAGDMLLDLIRARQVGLSFPGLERLQTLLIGYENNVWPHRLHMLATNLPPATPSEAGSSEYTYERSENGAGGLAFTWVQDTVPGPAGLDTLQIKSRWRATGEGRMDLEVTAGDNAGTAGSVECWDPNFSSTYRLASWAPPATGDETTCIPAL